MRRVDDQRFRLFLLPCMQQLQSVRLTSLGIQLSECDFERLLQALVALPQLHSLLLRLSLNSYNLAGLAAAPCLTRLDTNDTDRLVANSRLPAIATFPRLLHLSVLRPAVYGPAWERFFSTPLASRLESLELSAMSKPRSWEDPERETQDYSAIRLMTSLRALALISMVDVKSILPHLAALPRLQRLVLELQVWNPSDPSLSTVPPLTVASLLESSSSPDLRCLYRLCLIPDRLMSLRDGGSVAGVHAEIAAFTERFREQVNNPRLSVEVTQDDS